VYVFNVLLFMLRASHLVVLSLKIMDMYPVKRRKKIIETADEKFKGSGKAASANAAGVLQLALLEVVTYKKAAVAALKSFEQTKSGEAATAPDVKDKKDKKKRKDKEKEDAPSKESALPAVSRSSIDAAGIPVGKSRIAHLEHVKLRLRFLEYLLSNSSLPISSDGVDLLWDCFITQALCAPERELAFAFLEKPNQNADGYPILPESVLQHIFSNKMLKMDGSQLSMAGYRLFERYFVTLNEKSAKVKRLQAAAEGDANANSATFVALASDLIGFENLWDIALSSEDASVADVAVEFLNSLHAPLEAAGVSKTRALKIRDDYVRASIDQLNAAAAKANSKRLERCFILLRNFVIDFEVRLQQTAGAVGAPANQLLKKKLLPSLSSSSSGAKAIGATSKIWLKCATKPSQRLVLDPTAVSVRAFREKAMEMFGFDSSDALQFLVDDEKDKELKDLDSLLSDYKVADQTSVYIKKVDSIAMVEEGQNGQTSVAPGAPEISVSNLMIDAMPFLFGGAGVVADAFKSLVKRSVVSSASDSIAEVRSGSQKAVASPAVPAVPVFSPAPASVLRLLAAPMKMDLKRVESHPARLLSSQQYFDKCYALLRSADDEAMARQIWELLSLLPRNDLLVKQIEDASKALSGGVDSLPAADSAFAQLFDVKSPYQLTYNLQIVESILARDVEVAASETPRPSQDAVSWRDVFATAGMVALLIKQLLARFDEMSSWTMASKRVVAQVLRVVVLLALERDPAKPSQNDVANFEGFRVRAAFAGSTKIHIIPQLMDVVRCSALRGSSVFIPQDQGADQDLDLVVAQESLTLLVPLITFNQANLQVFCKQPDLQDWMISVLLKAPQNSTRENAARAMSAILARSSVLSLDAMPAAPKKSKSKKQVDDSSDELTPHVDADGAFYLSLLLPAVETDEIEQYAEVCDQYFTVLETLFNIHSAGIQTSSLVRKFAKKIIRHPIVEQHATAGVEDKVLIGLMKLVLAIIRHDPELKESCGKLLIREIMQENLFAIPTAETHHKNSKTAESLSLPSRDPPKCKTQAARRMAFSLLVELARDCPSNFKSVCDLLLVQAESIDMQNEYNFSPSSKEKSLCGYVGLQNQGATCYMNSLMQQLYCIPEFRQGILLAKESDEVVAADLAAAEKAAAKAAEKSSKEMSGPVATSAAGVPLKENVLFQMQRMFAFLQESEKRYFDTKEFCTAYKDPDGKPINTSQQMDANEYYQRLFDLIEKRLKGSNQESILHRVFGGLLSNQLIPTECSHRRAREEPFFNIGVEIKNKGDLRESLQLFVEGELLTGDNKYNCEVCQKPVETLKRCCIEKLPPVLVVQLKRFEFDYEKMRNEKLNTACSFPMELDMEPYTKEGLARREADRGMSTTDAADTEMKPPSYYQYELAGIVVHTGSADFGHYYSYIRERVPQYGSKERRWFEFNDTIVTPFDPNRIPAECFGGEEEIIEWTDMARTQKRKVKRQKAYNAYILFYERKGVSQPQLSLEQIRLLTPQPSLMEIRRSRLNQHKRNFSADDLAAAASDQPPVRAADDQSEEAHDKTSKSHRRSTSVDIRSSNSKKDDLPDDVVVVDVKGKKALDSSSSSEDEAPRDEPPTRSNRADVVEQTKASLRRSALRRSQRDHQEDSPDESLSSAHLVAERITNSSAPSAASAESQRNFRVGARAAMFVAKLAVASKKRKQQVADNLALASGISLEELDLLQIGSGQRLTGRRCEVGPEILSSIWEDNSMFLIRKLLYDPDYFAFVWQISNLYSVPGSKSKLVRKHRTAYTDVVASDTSMALKRLIPADQAIPFDLAGEVDKDRAVAAAAEAQAKAAKEAASQSVMGGLSNMASSIFGSGGSSGSGSSSSSGGAIPGTSSKDKIKVDYKGDRAKEEALNAKEKQKQQEKEKAERERREKEKEKERAAGLEDIPADPKDNKKDGKDSKDAKDAKDGKEKDKKDADKDKEKDKDKEAKKDKDKKKEKGGIDENWTDIGEDGKKSKKDKEKDKDVQDKEKDVKEKEKEGDSEKPKGTARTSSKEKISSKPESSSSESSGHKKKKSNEVETPPISRVEKYDPILHNVEMGTRFVLHILAHARDRPMLPYWISSLVRMFHSSPAASRWFLESLIYDAEQLKNILLACPAEKVRQAAARLIFAAIETLADEEHSKYTQTAKLLSQGPLTDPPAPSTIIWFMDKLLTTMLRMAKRKSSLNVDQMFWVIAQFARVGSHERYYLLKQGALILFTDFARHFADRATPISRYNSPAQQHLHWLLDCVGTILLTCKMSPDTSNLQPPTSLGDKHSIHLPDADYEAAYAKAFLYAMLREEVNIDAMGALLYHSCWENSAMSDFVLGIVKDGLTRVNWTAYNGFLNMFAVVTSIQDSISDHRVDSAIDKFLAAMKDAVKSTNRRAIEKLIAFMIKLSNESEIFRRKILRRRTAVNDILSIAGYRLSAV
jgi:ubiquitin C-terminal hydrolase